MATTDPAVEQLLTRLDRAWTAFNDSYAGLPDALLEERGVVDDWSVKDILAHVSTWEAEAVKHLPLILEGGRPRKYVTYGGIDAFNALRTEQRRDLTPAEVLRQHDENHERLIEYVRAASEELFAEETRFRRRLRLDTYGHYPKHARAIREWRRRSGLSSSG